METKTIKEWLETLDEPYRSQALELVLYPNVIVKDVINALYGAFNFITSPQGKDYWHDLVELLISQERMKGH